MKKVLLKQSIVLTLLMFFFFTASAQITDVNFSSLQVSAGLASIKCADRASFQLTASADDGAGHTYASYRWLEVNASGGADEISGETTATLTRANVTPGYHTYRVYGKTDNQDGVVCQSDDFEDFTVYVLPQLNVLATIPTGTVLKYCANNIPQDGDANAIRLTASVAGFVGSQNQVNNLTNPVHTDFVYDYRWYRIDASNNRTLVSSNPTYIVTGADAGNFSYEVAVNYRVKNDGSPYARLAQLDGVNAQIVVIPTPGKPTITIL